MTYEEFQQLARLFVVGALDDDEMEQFFTGRNLFGSRAEEFIRECRKLNSVFALSLQPKKPAPATKAKLMARILNASRSADRKSPRTEESLRLAHTFEARYCGRH